MIYLRQITKTKIPQSKQSEFPFCVPIVTSFHNLKFSQAVSIFVGENGAGKSVLLEGVAASCNLPIVGSRNFDQDKTLQNAIKLANHLKLSWNLKKNKGFFLRAEDFFGFTKRLHQLRAELTAEIERLDSELVDGYGKQLAISTISGQIHELTARYGVDLDAASHGESFLKLFQSRIMPNGLYLLDEPEAPLSPNRQMSLLRLIHDAVKQGSQFIIATHSPILMSYPDATIFDFNTSPPQEVQFRDIEHVQTLTGFLANPQIYLRNLLDR